VPPEVDLKGACVIACTTGTTLQALRQIAHLSAGESVLVTGAGGGLGIQGMQVAKALGCQTIAVTSSETKVAALRAYGADQVVLTRDRDFWRQILEATDGRGVDVVLDNVGAPSLFGPSFRALAQRGRYVFTGQVARAKVEVYPAFIFAKEAVITGSVSTLMSTFVDSMELVRAGQVQTVVQEFALDDIVGAHEVMDGRGFLGRGILVP
jgi:NADPH:quinone reductase-like Zn-dependent oxidoreductase